MQQRRKRQATYNKKHGIIPQSVVKGLLSVPYAAQGDAYTTTPIAAETTASYQTTEEIHKTITRLEGEMLSFIETTVGQTFQMKTSQPLSVSLTSMASHSEYKWLFTENLLWRLDV